MMRHFDFRMIHLKGCLRSQILSNHRGFASLVSNEQRARPHHSGWSGLGAFAVADSSIAAWRTLKNNEAEVEAIIERHLHPRMAGSPEASIDWNYWEKRIKHKPIVDCLRNAYEEHLKLLDAALQQDHMIDTSLLPQEEQGWNLYEQAVQSCEKAVVASEELVADGARALWVSHRNPPAWSISPEEWLDTDLWWQAYIERHFHYDPAKDTDSFNSETFEADSQNDLINKEWKKKTDLFHDRTDTPTLYQYMDQLHSSDYYDIHRRVFLEHMLYFLIRTGNNFRLFPEIPPMSWISDIERLRFKWLQNAHSRRKIRQFIDFKREEPLDLCPPDSEIEHHGEEHFMKLLLKDKVNWESMVGRLMGDFIFLSHPAIAITNTSELHKAWAVDEGKGDTYSLGADVSALFYVPITSAKPFSPKTALHDNPLPSPMELMNSWIGFIAMSGLSLNPGYEELLRIHSELIHKRGQHWFAAPGESMADAFLSRLATDDPNRKVYELYVQQLRERWESAKKITFIEALEMINDITNDSNSTNKLFCIHKEMTSSTGTSKLLEEIASLQASGRFEETMKDQNIKFVSDDQKEVPIDQIKLYIKKINEERAGILEVINAAKLPSL